MQSMFNKFAIHLKPVIKIYIKHNYVTKNPKKFKQFQVKTVKWFM
jgi:hypothetical protein